MLCGLVYAPLTPLTLWTLPPLFHNSFKPSGITALTKKWSSISFLISWYRLIYFNKCLLSTHSTMHHTKIRDMKNCKLAFKYIPNKLTKSPKSLGKVVFCPLWGLLWFSQIDLVILSLKHLKQSTQLIKSHPLHCIGLSVSLPVSHM